MACIEWTGSLDSMGYGLKRVKGKLWKIHRLTYTQAFGDIPEGLEVMHSCDNRKCYNIEHLSLGTHKENMQDMVNKGRSVSFKGMEQTNAKLTDSDVLAIRATTGISQRKLAAMYGIAQSTLSSILLRKSWRHI